MGRPRRVNCKRCGRHIDEAGPLSARGLCETCSVEAVDQAARQMVAGEGPIFDKWAAKMAPKLAAYLARTSGTDSSSDRER